MIPTKYPSLTIITICKDICLTIEKTIQSIVGQTYQDFQWIVIDGASQDGTLEILDKFKNRIDILVSEKDNGIYNAMNKGLRLAKGEYIYFLNGGDYLFDTTTLEKILSHPLIEDFIYGNIMVFNGMMNPYILKMPTQISLEFLYNKSIPHQSTFTKKSVFEKTSGFNESFPIAADYELTLRAFLLHSSKFQFVNNIFAWYLPYGASDNEENRILEKDKIHRKYFSFLKRSIYSNRMESFYYTKRNHFGNYLKKLFGIRNPMIFS